MCRVVFNIYFTRVGSRIFQGGAPTLELEEMRQPIITARKRSLRRLCFYRCLSVQGGFSIGGVLHPGGGCSIQGGILHLGGFSIPGGSPCGGVLHPGGLSIRSMCGRYASYWNAFLFGKILAESCMKCKNGTPLGSANAHS